jgi:co-chaperonin GroES (HSP10)
MALMFEPLGDRVLLKILVGEKKTASGIILPIEAVTARVVAVGPGTRMPYEDVAYNEETGEETSDGTPAYDPIDVEVGDIVVLPKGYKQHCEEILHAGSTHYVATEQLMLGILVEEPEAIEPEPESD